MVECSQQEVRLIGQARADQTRDAPGIGVEVEHGGKEAVGLAHDLLSGTRSPLDLAPQGGIADIQLLDPGGGGCLFAFRGLVLGGVLPVDGQLNSAFGETGLHQLLRELIEQPLATVAAGYGRACWNQLDPLRRLAIGQRCGEVCIEGDLSVHAASVGGMSAGQCFRTAQEQLPASWLARQPHSIRREWGAHLTWALQIALKPNLTQV